MSTGIFIPMTKCVHEIPYHGCTHETNSSSSSSLVFTGDIINSSQNLSCRDHFPYSVCVGSLMSYGMFIYRYDGYYDLQVYIVLNGQKTRKSNHAFAAVIKKVALSSQLYVYLASQLALIISLVLKSYNLAQISVIKKLTVS